MISCSTSSNNCLLLLTSTTFTPLSNSLHPTQQHLFLFSTSRFHLTSLVKLRPISMKPTDKHQYLLQSSCHPPYTKRAIPFSLALRLRLICSSDESFTLRANELIKYLNDRGYNLSFLKKEIQRVHAITCNKTLKPSQTTTSLRCTRN